MKKNFLVTLCIVLVVMAGVPRQAHAYSWKKFKKQFKQAIGFVFGPIALIDPLTALAIADAYSCKVNIVWGCDKNGNPLPEPLPIITLTTSDIVELPNPVSLNWTANARAVSCSASDDWNGDRALSGSEAVIDPTGPGSLGAHRYTLSCKNSEGRSASATASTIVVGPSVTLTAPDVIEVPAHIPLNWSSQNTVSCAALGEWSGNKGVSGNEAVLSPTDVASRGIHTYGMTCVNSSNYSATTSASVRVIQVPQCSFSANPTAIIPPQSSSLSWSCAYTSSCSIDKGVGPVNPVSGFRKVLPREATTYSLNCLGLDGTRAFQTTVSVGATTSPRIREVNP